MGGLTDAAPWWGAWPDGDATRFRVWAPACDTAWLLQEGDAPVPMTPDGDGGFHVRFRCASGTRYRFRLGEDVVPDPASRCQPEGIDGPSAVLDPGGYAWQASSWKGRPWDEVVLYEVHAGVCGGFEGVRRQLALLARLGVTAIELMPVGTFPGTRNWGYDGVLPYAPAAAYGTPEALKALVDDAHAHGLMVFLDVVYNHFGPHGNFLPRYAPAFFRRDTPTPWGEAIDFEQPHVQRYFIDNALMWLHEYRFDGLRLDAVHAITPPAFLGHLRDAIRASAPPDRHIHLVLENEHNTASWLSPCGYDAQWNDDFHNALHVLLTGEREGYYAAFVDAPEAHLARVLAEGFAYQGQPDPRGHVRGEPSTHIAPRHFVAFVQNHDQIGNRAFGDRLCGQLPKARLRAAMALTALTPMVPLFFMGAPWCATAPFPFFTDFQAPLDAAVREGRRREFAQFAAFADPDARARIPDPNDPATCASAHVDPADATHGAGAAHAEWFTQLLALRRALLVPRLGRLRAEGAAVIGQGAVTAAWHDGVTRIALCLNLGPQPVAFPNGAVAIDGAWRSDGGNDAAQVPPDVLALRWGPLR